MIYQITVTAKSLQNQYKTRMKKLEVSLFIHGKRGYLWKESEDDNKMDTDERRCTGGKGNATNYKVLQSSPSGDTLGDIVGGRSKFKLSFLVPFGFNVPFIALLVIRVEYLPRGGFTSQFAGIGVFIYSYELMTRHCPPIMF